MRRLPALRSIKTRPRYSSADTRHTIKYPGELVLRNGNAPMMIVGVSGEMLTLPDDRDERHAMIEAVQRRITAELEGRR